MNKKQKWFLLKFLTPPHSKEYLQYICWQNNCIGLEEKTDSDTNLITLAYFNCVSDLQKSKAEIERYANRNEFDFIFETKKITDEKWKESWHKFFKPHQIGSKFAIHPPWDYPHFIDRHAIEINPGQAFGTGLHESTILCIELMEDTELKNKVCLDMGCGSGILSIVASHLGAKAIISVDNDKIAVDETRDNAERNHLKQIIFPVVGTPNCLGINKCEYMIANLEVHIFREFREAIANAMKNKGILIVSGFLVEYKCEIMNFFSKYNFKSMKELCKNQWTGCLLIKNDN